MDVRAGIDAAKEEVVVEGHAGDVEGIGFGRVAGEFNDQGLWVLVLEGSAYMAAVSHGSAGGSAGTVPAVDSFSSSIMCCW